MKKKTFIKLSSSMLAKIDKAAGAKLSRSAFVERVLRLYFHRELHREMQADDLRRINAGASRLNAEAADVLAYQWVKN